MPFCPVMRKHLKKKKKGDKLLHFLALLASHFQHDYINLSSTVSKKPFSQDAVIPQSPCNNNENLWYHTCMCSESTGNSLTLENVLQCLSHVVYVPRAAEWLQREGVTVHHTVLVLAGVITFTVVGMGSCFELVLETALRTQGCFSHSWVTLTKPFLHLIPPHEWGEWGCTELGGNTVRTADSSWPRGYSIAPGVILRI